MAAGPYVQSPILESSPVEFRRSRSRVFYESDCSSPTSWEFCGQPISSPYTIPEESEILHFGSPVSSSSPMSTSGTVLRMSTGPLQSTHLESIRIDGSRNSTGSSSSESHRSHDSGFLDSIETRRVRSRQSHSSNHQSQNHNSNNSETRRSGSSRSESSPKEPFVYVNGPSSIVHRTPPTRGCNHPPDEVCRSCLYQEVIVARSKPGTISPLPAETNSNGGCFSVPELLGVPACASTPKKSLSPFNMQKIDNFESLNKNMKDRNNNKSNLNGSTSNANDQNGNLIHFLNSTKILSSLKNERHSVPSISKSIENYSKSYSTSEFRRVEPISSKQNLNSSEINSFPVTPHHNNEIRGNELHKNSSHERDFYKSSPKWQSLPRGFKRVSVNSFNTSQDLIVKSHFDNDAMRLWLHELRFQVEPDCLHSLQTKSVITPGPRTGQDQHILHSTNSISTPFLSIRHIEKVASFISQEYSFICKYLEAASFEKVPGLILDLLVYIEDFLKDLQDLYGKLEKLETYLAHCCYQLRLSITALSDEPRETNLSAAIQNVHLNLDSSFDKHSLPHQSSFERKSQKSDLLTTQRQNSQNNKRSVILAEIVEGMVGMGNLFSQVVDHRITCDLYSILDMIGGGGLYGKLTLQVFTPLLDEGGMHMSRLASRIRTVRTLLSAILDSRDEFERILCLRCLATVLCIGEAVNDFDKAGGFEIIADILHDPQPGLQLKYEAVAVLTQATDPWIDLEATLTCLRTHLEKIIVSLTHLIPFSQSEEDNFLLTMAAISNLTFLELSSMQFLRSYRTVSLITSAVEKKHDFSVFVKDQVSTIFANMAGIESCRGDIVQNHGVELLIQFLQTSPLGLKSSAEVTACERLQQKSTIAISRLANEEGVAQVVLELGGIQRLVQLCRMDRERNYSDGVLIACLATLRKLVSICGSEVIKELEAEELIQPRLLDSFLLFSSRQESYV